MSREIGRLFSLCFLEFAETGSSSLSRILAPCCPLGLGDSCFPAGLAAERGEFFDGHHGASLNHTLAYVNGLWYKFGMYQSGDKIEVRDSTGRLQGVFTVTDANAGYRTVRPVRWYDRLWFYLRHPIRAVRFYLQ